MIFGVVIFFAEASNLPVCRWRFHPAEKLNTLPYPGIFATYGSGGYYLDLGEKKEFTGAKIQDLKKNLWIDRGSRAVIIDFTVYNTNVNLFVVCK